LKIGGAKNLREYVNYANKIAQEPRLHKTKESIVKGANGA
jgi:hypothetical protein